MSAPEFTGGMILVHWRYLNEDADLKEFLVSRVAGGVVTEVGRVSASLAADWKTEVLRDSTLVAGVEVTYRVTGILISGSETTRASSSITIEGTQFDVTADPDRLLIELTWSRAPQEATGFRIYRGLADSNDPAILIFETEAADVRSFEDTDLTGNLPYVYTLDTVMGGTSIRSAPTEGQLFALLASPQTDVGQRYGVRTIVVQSAITAGPNHVDAFLIGETATGMVHISGTEIDLAESGDRDFTDFSPHSLSVMGGTLEHWSHTPRFTTVFAGLNAARNEAFLVVKDFSSTRVTRTWPSSSANRTGLSEFGFDVLMFEGTTLRAVDPEFEDQGEPMIIEMGEPIDIDYLDGSVWLAYPGRLFRSNPTTSLETLTSWEEVSIPSDVSVTAIVSFDGRLAVLDGTDNRLHLLSLQGEILLSWDAPGENLVNGDVGRNGGHTLLYQSEPGGGRVHIFDPASLGVTGPDAGNPSPIF